MHDTCIETGIWHPQASSKRSLAATAAVNGALTAAVRALGSGGLADSALAMDGLTDGGSDKVVSLAESALVATA